MALFISLEGPDGSGKSTQARLLADALQERGYSVTATREPGGTLLGERVRDLVLDPASPSATPLAMAILMSASRAQLVHDVIAPARKEGRVVVADRFADSTIAYQCFGLGLDLEVARTLAAIATGGLYPDVTIYVDVAPAVGLRRAAARGARNRLDAQSLAFHERVRQGYLALIAEEPRRWNYIDGDAPPETVHQSIMEALEPVLRRMPPAA
jgi:dTMP kinase